MRLSCFRLSPAYVVPTSSYSRYQLGPSKDSITKQAKFIMKTIARTFNFFSGVGGDHVLFLKHLKKTSLKINEWMIKRFKAKIYDSPKLEIICLQKLCSKK